MSAALQDSDTEEAAPAQQPFLQPSPAASNGSRKRKQQVEEGVPATDEGAVAAAVAAATEKMLGAEGEGGEEEEEEEEEVEGVEAVEGDEGAVSSDAEGKKAAPAAKKGVRSVCV
jgi:hypothetical protein